MVHWLIQPTPLKDTPIPYHLLELLRIYCELECLYRKQQTPWAVLLSQLF